MHRLNLKNVSMFAHQNQIGPRPTTHCPKSGFSVFVPQRLNDYRGHQLTSLQESKTQTREELIPQLKETLHYDMHTANKCIATRVW